MFDCIPQEPLKITAFTYAIMNATGQDYVVLFDKKCSYLQVNIILLSHTSEIAMTSISFTAKLLISTSVTISEHAEDLFCFMCDFSQFFLPKLCLP